MSGPGPGTAHIISVGISLFGNVSGGRSAVRRRVKEHAREVADRVGGKADRITGDTIGGSAAGAAASGVVGDKDHRQNGRELRDRQARWLSRAIDAGTEERAVLDELLADVTVDRWPPELSAELTALAAYLGMGSPVLEPEDTAVLIASDTGPGLRASLFNAAAMAGGDLDRVRYLHEPSDGVAGLRGKVVVVRVPQLDAGDTAGFVEAMRNLGGVGRGVCRLVGKTGAPGSEDRVVRFHASGGFKSALPFVLGMAEAMRSILGPLRVKAFGVHELDSTSAVELPLKSFPADFLKECLVGVDANGTFKGDPPNGQPLRGFAYDPDPDGTRWRLTPFGHALYEILPEASDET